MWSKMVDMELTDEEKLDMMMPCISTMSNQPDYPYGLKICLTEKEIGKLRLSADCEVGEVIDMRAFAEVTSVSVEKRDGKETCRIELQIQRLALENESTESTGDEDE